MPKLPKDLQKKKKQQIARAKGSSNARAGSSRAMRRKLAQQGIEAMDEIPAKRVIIECEDKNIVIEDPQVIALTQQGMTVHQIIGNAVEHELDEDLGIGVAPSMSSSDSYIAEQSSYEETDNTENIEAVAKPTINEQDIMIVSSQAGVSEDEARKALEEANGDLARAILNLKTK